MFKKLVLSSASIVLLVIVASFSIVGKSEFLTTCLPTCGGIVEKAPESTFTVEITFKNVGAAEGIWSVNVAFEGDSWTWTGSAKTLTLEPYGKRTLTWNGSVPSNAPVDSTARLIVYYNDSFKPLQWWIHVVPGAELAITSSTVR